MWTVMIPFILLVSNKVWCCLLHVGNFPSVWWAENCQKSGWTSSQQFESTTYPQFTQGNLQNKCLEETTCFQCRCMKLLQHLQLSLSSSHLFMLVCVNRRNCRVWHGSLQIWVATSATGSWFWQRLKRRFRMLRRLVICPKINLILRN